MGIAEIIPGVSGGTLAFITGIYQELINSIKSINVESIRALTKFQFEKFWRHINGSFLLTLLTGMITSILLIFSKIKFRDIIAGGFLLSARFSLIIAMAEIGVHLDLISVELEQQIILLAVITATFSPILFRIFRSKAN